MESAFILSLDFKSHKIRALFLKKHKEFASLVPKHFKVCVKVQTEDLNLDGYSVDFCVVKNAIREVSKQVEGKIVLNNFLNQVRVDEANGLVQVSSELEGNFSISQEFVILMNGADVEKEFGKHLISLTLNQMKIFYDMEDFSAIQISVINLNDGKETAFFSESKKTGLIN